MGIWKNIWEKIKTVLNGNKITIPKDTAIQKAISLWSDMYKDNAPWLSDSVHSLGIAALIASEKARLATIEMDIKITGDSERADFIRNAFTQVVSTIRAQLEYGIALGSLIIKPYVTKGINGKYVIKIGYVTADNFFPISFSPDGDMTSVGFIDKVVKDNVTYTKIEVHTLEGTTLTVENLCFSSKTGTSSNYFGTPVPLSTVPEWSELEQSVTIVDIDTPLYAWFRNPEANTLQIGSRCGASGFSRAVDLIKQADLMYSNLLWEFEGGQLAIDVDCTAFNHMKDPRGKDISKLPKLQERLYRRNLDLGDGDLYQIFSPPLRDVSIINGLNNILIHIEDATSLARGTISEVAISEARTATELKILKQRAYAANADIQKQLEETFKTVIRIIDKYCDLYEICPKGSFEVAYHWDDSILVDKDAERQLDMIDVEKQILSRVEYRMKWYGETEAQAQEAIKKADMEASQRVQQTNQSLLKGTLIQEQKASEQAISSGEIKNK